jgi:hypothetical protein
MRSELKASDAERQGYLCGQRGLGQCTGGGSLVDVRREPTEGGRLAVAAWSDNDGGKLDVGERIAAGGRTAASWR